jgi:hypothetical protein
VHLIADGDVRSRIPDAGQAALLVAENIRRRNEFRAERLKPGAHHRIVGAGWHGAGRMLRDQLAVEYEIPEHLGRKTAPPHGHSAEHDDARIGLVLQRDHRLGHIAEMLFPGSVQQYDIGLDLPDERENPVIHRAAIGRAHDIGVERRNAGIGGKLGDTKVSGFLSLAQTGQQGSRG